MTSLRCPECDQPTTPPSVRCCCARCLHPLADHANNLDCRTCRTDGRPFKCGLDCTVFAGRGAPALPPFAQEVLAL